MSDNRSWLVFVVAMVLAIFAAAAYDVSLPGGSGVDLIAGDGGPVPAMSPHESLGEAVDTEALSREPAAENERLRQGVGMDGALSREAKGVPVVSASPRQRRILRRCDALVRCSGVQIPTDIEISREGWQTFDLQVSEMMEALEGRAQQISEVACRQASDLVDKGLVQPDVAPFVRRKPVPGVRTIIVNRKGHRYTVNVDVAADEKTREAFSEYSIECQLLGSFIGMLR